MTTKQHGTPAFSTGVLLACLAIGSAQAQPAATAEANPSWHSPSLRSETVTGPNGAVTTHAALSANEKWGIGAPKRVEQVTDGVYAMRAAERA